MNLFKLFASISLDKSDYDKGVKEATDQGESLASKLGGGLAKAGQVAAKGLTLIGGAATAAVAVCWRWSHLPKNTVLPRAS